MDTKDLDKQLQKQTYGKLEKELLEEYESSLLREKCWDDLCECGLESDLKTIAKWLSERTGKFYLYHQGFKGDDFTFTITCRNKFTFDKPVLRYYLSKITKFSFDEVFFIQATPATIEDGSKRPHHFVLRYQDSLGNRSSGLTYKECIKVIRKIVVDKIEEQESK